MLKTHQIKFVQLNIYLPMIQTRGFTAWIAKPGTSARVRRRLTYPSVIRHHSITSSPLIGAGSRRKGLAHLSRKVSQSNRRLRTRRAQRKSKTWKSKSVVGNPHQTWLRLDLHWKPCEQSGAETKRGTRVLCPAGSRRSISFRLPSHNFGKIVRTSHSTS